MAAEIWVMTVEVVGAPGPDSGTRMPDITGFEVSARDGNIGKIEEVVRLDDGRTYRSSIAASRSSRRSA
jgi:hypothetical protein